ncbi:TPA: choloylglycine hydrolase family protein [Salmonella enterica subsp. enterica serovar Newport]|uniref:choloylglycine hydrolase family protein n=1 Tax=Salmonella enterica TaxID=28901 RepID=UPI000A18488B|nr:linear amide C-N hydrolase [Salmonella enterica]OSJ63401.1 hydrolase [Salmonella enterica subsp. enterica serovar Newport str. SHSN005]
MMNKSKTMLFIAPALFSYALAAQACTTLAIQDKQGDIFHGRTLEYMQDLPSWLTYYPAGTQFDKKTPDGSQGVSYQAKYPILAITSTITDGDSRDILEGMNSAGLSFSENMIMNAQLPPLPASEYKQAIPITSLGEWALARFATVGEVKQAIKEGKFWSPELHRFGDLKSPFHYAFYDKKGGSIVVEVENGKFHVYDNPTRVMTNGPAFPWHLTNLNNYTQLTNVDRSSGTLGGIKVMQPDSGIAIADLPSSDTSVSRFIRGVYYTTYAPQATSAHDAMNTLAHIMSRFDRPKNITVDYMGSEGEGNATRKPVSEYTVWTTLSDLTHGEMMVRGYNDINYKTWSLSQFKNATAPVFEKINVKG